MLNTILLVIGLLTSPSLDDLQAGQVWTMNAPGYENTRIIIGPHETWQDGSTVVHIAIDNLPAPPGGMSPAIGHLPVDANSVLAALGAQIDAGESITDIEAGMAIWADAEGGVFTTSVVEIVETILPQMFAQVKTETKT